MSVLASIATASDAELIAQYRGLDLEEQDVKRELAQAAQKLEGIRDLKKQIGVQIFQAQAPRPYARFFNAVTTTHNGPTQPA